MRIPGRSPSPARHRFSGEITGVGSTSGVRVVIGYWPKSPYGPFTDAMIERPDGHRLLIAPTERVADFVRRTYAFDEVRIEPISGTPRDGVRSPSLSLRVTEGRRTPLGWLLRAVPHRLATSPMWARAIDPVARIVMRGVRTAGTALEGRREYYGATDLRAVVALSGSLDGVPLGELAPIDPPCHFGFSSTPRTPSVTTLVTTVVEEA